MRRNVIRHLSQAGQYLQCRKNSDYCSFYVTTPIFYVNASPHLGHLYSAVYADASQRFERIRRGGKTFLSSGTDEHGSKVQTAAGLLKPQIYCDQISSHYQKMLELYDVDCGEFVRTTSLQHKTAVTKFWELLNSRGYLYQGKYEGWYCEADEAFVPESRVVQSPESSSAADKIRVSAESGRSVEWTCEQNYLFKLSSCKDDLLHWLKNEKVVYPPKFHKLLICWVNEGLGDVSVTRPASRVPWGLPVPSDPSHTIYVWFDALVNYLTAVGYPNKTLKRWPPDLHVLGKDILRFHGLLWPSLLLAAGLEPPKRLLCHSHWLVDGEKMAKSRGNVINPCLEEAQKFTTSGLRYFLLREGVSHSDGNYNEEKARRIINSELADKLGNLLNRCTGLSLNPQQIWPSINTEHEVLLSTAALSITTAVTSLPNIALEHFEDCNFYKVVDSVMAVLQEANKFFESQKPWELKRNGTELEGILCITIETLRVCGIILQPIIPKISSQLLDKLGVETSQRMWKNLDTFAWDNLPSEERKLSSEKATLFQRLLFK